MLSNNTDPDKKVSGFGGIHVEQDSTEPSVTNKTPETEEKVEEEDGA